MTKPERMYVNKHCVFHGSKMCQYTICTSFCLCQWTLIRETHQQTVRCFKLSLQLSERSVIHLDFSPQYLTLQFEKKRIILTFYKCLTIANTLIFLQFLGRISVAHIFSFLHCISCFVCLSSQSCTQ